MQTKIRTDQKVLAEHVVELPNGTKILTEIISQGAHGVLVGTFLVQQDEPRLLSWCGYCDGQLIGCVDCPNKDPVLDCVQRRIYCAS